MKDKQEAKSVTKVVNLYQQKQFIYRPYVDFVLLFKIKLI